MVNYAACVGMSVPPPQAPCPSKLHCQTVTSYPSLSLLVDEMFSSTCVTVMPDLFPEPTGLKEEEEEVTYGLKK